MLQWFPQNIKGTNNPSFNRFFFHTSTSFFFATIEQSYSLFITLLSTTQFYNTAASKLDSLTLRHSLSLPTIKFITNYINGNILINPGVLLFKKRFQIDWIYLLIPTVFVYHFVFKPIHKVVTPLSCMNLFFKRKFWN